MGVDHDVLESLKLTRGETPLSQSAFVRRILNHTDAAWPRAAQELQPDAFEAWKVAMTATRDAASANNLFNHQLTAYRAAVARLDQYRVADGRPEVVTDFPTGDLDSDGAPVVESMVVQEAIDPAPAMIQQDTHNEAGEVTGQAEVRNPAIVQDDAERAAAQAVIDATPTEVKAWLATD